MALAGDRSHCTVIWVRRENYFCVFQLPYKLEPQAPFVQQRQASLTQ